MQVGETYRIADAPYLSWFPRHRVITHIDADEICYHMENESKVQRYSRKGIEEAIRRKDWILLYPSRIALPQGV